MNTIATEGTAAMVEIVRFFKTTQSQHWFKLADETLGEIRQTGMLVEEIGGTPG